LVDDGFNPALTKESSQLAAGASGDMVIQPDGKMIMRAVYVQSDNTVASYLFRLNPDGSPDTTFNCQLCPPELPFLQPDGKLLFVVEAQGGPNGVSYLKLMRFNSDGSLNAEIPTALNRGGGFSISGTIWAVQPDGKIFVESNVFHQFAAPKSLHRLNPDGTLDASFQPIVVNSRFYDAVVDFILLPDGKFYRLDGGSSGTVAGNIYRHNADGTQDATFDRPALACSNCAPLNLARPYSIALQPDGKILMGGDFTSVNGLTRNRFVRLHPAGNVDLDFTSAPGSISQIIVLPDNKILLLGGFGNASLIRLNADGSTDNAFNAPTDIIFYRVKVDSLGRVVFFGKFADQKFKFGRLNPNGTLETVFSLPAVKGTVSTLARQPDGKTIVAGEFDKINGVTRNKIARLNADGSVDTTFDPLSGFDVPPSVIAFQTDGKILAGGDFTLFNGAGYTNIIRLNADGTLDAAFNPLVDSPVRAIAVQPDGRILIGGAFTTVNNTNRTGLARLNPDGGLDDTLNPIINNPTIRAIVVEADGKIVIGGSFSGIDGFSRSNLARLNANGSVDATFNAGSIGGITRLVRQADGKYLYAATVALGRRNSDGSADGGFVSPGVSNSSSTAVINDFAVQPNGTIIIGGLFTSVGGSARNNLARLLSNGALDKFYLLSGANREVKALLSQPDGKTIVGGLFTSIETTSRTGLARLNNAAVITGPIYFDFDGDGKSDLSVFRPSTGYWYIARPNGIPSQNFDAVQFGASGDVIVPADYDGDGKTDVAVFRPSDGTWYLQQSTAGFKPLAFGQSGDIPMPADYDGDGKANLAVFRPSTGSWYIARPTGIPSQNFDTVPFGTNGDVPVRGDFDGDGKADVTVFRPSTGDWYRLNSTNAQFVGIHFGVSEDKPVAADYDGDGKTDLAVFRPSEGNWYYVTSGDQAFHGIHFGVGVDKPVPADYDGDGKADFGVYRPTDGVWYLLKTTSGFAATQFGAATDAPIPNAFVRN
jgi:uncharacterized delta-60 repeat protein